MKGMTRIGLLLLALTAALALLALLPTAGADTITVPDDYQTVVEAVEAASPGDDIVLKGGVYWENITVDKPLNITGQGAGTEIQARSVFALHLAGDGINLSSMKVTGGSHSIYITGGNCTVRDVHQSGSIRGLHMVGAHNCTVEDCQFLSNSYTGIGMYDRSVDNKFRNITCTDNSAFGIDVFTWSSRNEFRECWLRGNNNAGILINGWSDDCTVIDCVVSDHRGPGVSVFRASRTSIINVTSWGSETHFGIHVGSDTDGSLVSNCTAYFNHLGGIKLYGERGGAVEDCLAYGNDGEGILVEISQDVEVTGCTADSNELHGILLSDSVRLTVRDCVVTDNRRGVGLTSGVAWGNVTHNDIVDNTLEGISALDAAEVMFHHNNLLGNNYDPIRMTYRGRQAEDGSTANSWDDGSEGNHWSDYGVWYPDATVTGKVWDTPYALPGGGKAEDTRPLALRWDPVPPVAMAGEDVEVPQGTVVTLDGGASTDNVGIVDHTWTFTHGGVDQVLTGAVVDFTFDIVGQYPVQLEVRDASGNTDADVMMVTVVDTEPPVAVAGGDVVVDMGETFTLDGSGSSDNVGIENYTWKVGTMTGTLDGRTVQTALEEAGTYPVTLEVVDASGHRGTDSLTVTVRDTEAPLAVAGDDVTVDQGTLVEMDATASSDNVGVASFTWTFEYGGEVVSYAYAKAAHLFETAGEYHVTLTVVDDAGNEGTDGLSVTVLDVTDPVAVAGDDVTVDMGDQVSLDGSGSYDDVAVAEHLWTFVYQDEPRERTGASFSFTFDEPGEYAVTLQVTDGAGNEASDAVRVTVLDTEAPTADAGEDVEVDEGQSVALSADSGDNVAVAEHLWTFDHMGNAISLRGKDTSFLFQEAGEYLVTLTVRDDAGNEATDGMTVTVRSLHVTWRLGPLVDRKGEPVPGVLLEVSFGASTARTVATQVDGYAEVVMAVEDLGDSVDVVATKDGWKTLEFQVDLGADGMPSGTLPEMARRPKEEEPGFGGTLAVLAITAVLVVSGSRGRR